MDPTPHVGMFNRVKNLEEAIFTNVGIRVSFISNLSFQSDPTHVAQVFVQTTAQHTKDGFTFSHTHAKQKQKE